MKNLLLVIGFFVSMHIAFGQATPTAYYRIANNTTILGVNMSAGTQVYDLANKKLYIVLRAVTSATTIESGLADADPYFKEIGGNSLSMKPSAENVSITGTLYVGSTVTGTYTYVSDPAAGMPEGTSTFKWYQADDLSGTNKAAISGATSQSYTIGSLAGKYLSLGVTPISTLPATGTEVLSSPWQYIYSGAVTASVSLTSDPALYIGQVLSPTPSFDPSSLGSCDQTANATYTWYRNSSASKTGATTISSGSGISPTYTVQAGDVGNYIGLEVTPDATCNAAVTAGINWKQVQTLTPAYANATISGLSSGKAQNGETITAVKGTYSTGPVDLTASEGTPAYQWYYATDGSGTGKTSITGQTSVTHAVNISAGYGYTDNTFYLAVGITPKTIGNETGTEVMSSWVQVNTITYAPDGITEVHEVTSPYTSRIWMDRNLGASQAASSITDADSYGDFYQWGRGADGHQSRTSTTTTGCFSGDTPGHALFYSVYNDTEWQCSGYVNYDLWTDSGPVANNPCPDGWRVPTITELAAECSHFANSNDAFNSFLKIPMGGWRESSGDLMQINTRTMIYTSSVKTDAAPYIHRYYYDIGSGQCIQSGYGPARACAIRCIKK